MDLNGRRLPGCVNRDGTRQKEAIPDEWGQAAVVSALVEGLAGLVDRGVKFDSVEVSPRWLFAGVADMQVRIGYGPHAQVNYDYQHDAEHRTFTVSLTGQFKHYTLRLPLPPGASLVSATVDGETAKPLLDQVNETNYVVISGDDDAASLVVHYKS